MSIAHPPHLSLSMPPHLLVTALSQLPMRRRLREARSDPLDRGEHERSPRRVVGVFPSFFAPGPLSPPSKMNLRPMSVRRSLPVLVALAMLAGCASAPDGSYFPPPSDP